MHETLKLYVPLWVLDEAAGSGWDVQRFPGFFKVVSDSEKLEITALEMLPLHLHYSAHIYGDLLQARCVLSPAATAVNSRGGLSY